MKKNIAFVALCMIGVMFQQSVCAENLISYNKGTVIIDGMDAGAERVAVSITKGEEIYAVGEREVDSRGSWQFKAKLPDVSDSVLLQLEVKPNGMALQTKGIWYAGTAVRNATLAAIKAANEETLSEILSANNIYTAGLLGLGIPIELYSGKEIQEYTKKILFNSVKLSEETEDTVGNDFTKAIAIARINCGDDEAIYDACDLEKTDKESNSLKKYISENKPYNSFSEFDEALSIAKALYSVNYCKYTELDDIMKINADALGLTKESLWNDYGKMADNRKKQVCESMVLSFANNAAMSQTEFLNIFRNAVNEKATPTQTGSSFAGSKRTGGSPMVNHVVGENNQTIEADVKNDEIFYDLNNCDWAKEAIHYMAQNNIVSGKGNHEFCPMDKVTREEFVKMLVNAFLMDSEEADVSFSDAEIGAWYMPYLKKSVKAGMVYGKPDGTFGVGEQISRQDVAVMCFRAAQLKKNSGGSIFKDDEKIADYAKDAVYTMRNLGVINGVEQNLFEPVSDCTRAQAAVMIYRLLRI